MEEFVANGFQGTLDFASGCLRGSVPVSVERMLVPAHVIAMVESAAELMASAIQESKRRMMAREREHLNWLSFLCHDLGAPLRRVLIRIEALEFNEELTPQEAHAALSSAHVEITQMTELIGSVDAFAHAESDTVRHFEETSLDQLLEYIITIFEFDASRKSIELDMRIAPGIGAVHIEKLLLRRAVENLISNAIRFTPAGGLISIRAEQCHDAICISVADTGAGIPSDEIDRIFEFGYRCRVQGDSSRCNSLGLGLALVRRVAELHKGDVAARNLSPHGAEFTITLPTRQHLITAR